MKKKIKNPIYINPKLYIYLHQIKTMLALLFFTVFLLLLFAIANHAKLTFGFNMLNKKSNYSLHKTFLIALFLSFIAAKLRFS